uniref:Uncharacterized protein n=1 Tax=Arundo donax TaxID=35708 RepID=A0A0A8YN81_ARUDO
MLETWKKYYLNYNYY